jgi:hypothetical protein
MVITKKYIVEDAINRRVDESMILRFKNLQQDTYDEIKVELFSVLYLVKNTIDLQHAKTIAKSYTKPQTKQHEGFIFIDRQRNKVWDGNHRLYAYYLSNKLNVPVIELYE